MVEVLISMTVLVLVVMAASNLLVSSIRANASNINTLVAYGLAQEGLEAVRNIRDSDWLLGASFSGTVGKNKNAVWGIELPSVIGNTLYYTVDFQQPSKMTGINSLNISSAAPWKLESLKPEDLKKGILTRLYKKENRVLKEIYYTHDATRGKVTPFRRFIMVSPVEYPLCGSRCVKKFRVASTVEWEEFGRTRQVRLDSELTDWKE